MPRLSVLFVRTALANLALGFTLGALLLWNKGIPINPQVWRLLQAHMEFLLIGWTVQLALGVAFWILPRWQTQRGDVRPAWVAYTLLNVGIWLVVLPPWFDAPAEWVTAGRVCEAAAAVAFARHAWSRTKPWVENTSPKA